MRLIFHQVVGYIIIMIYVCCAHVGVITFMLQYIVATLLHIHRLRESTRLIYTPEKKNIEKEKKIFNDQISLSCIAILSVDKKEIFYI